MQVNGIKTKQKKKQQAKEEFTAKQLKTRMIEANFTSLFYWFNVTKKFHDGFSFRWNINRIVSEIELK